MPIIYQPFKLHPTKGFSINCLIPKLQPNKKKRMIRYCILTFLCLSGLFACNSSPKPKTGLLGEWKSVKPDIGQTYIFKENNQLDWVFTAGEITDTFHLSYSIPDSATQIQLNWNGRIWYGITEVKCIGDFSCRENPV